MTQNPTTLKSDLSTSENHEEQSTQYDETTYAKTAFDKAFTAKGLFFLLGQYFENIEHGREDTTLDKSELAYTLSMVTRLGRELLDDCAIAVSDLEEFRDADELEH